MFLVSQLINDQRMQQEISQNKNSTQNILKSYLRSLSKTRSIKKPEPDIHRMMNFDIERPIEILDDKDIKKGKTMTIVEPHKKPSAKKKFHDIYSKITGHKFVVETKEDERLDYVFYKKFINFECANALFSFLSIFSSVAHHEITYVNEHKNFTCILYFVMFLSILLWINIILYEKTILEYNKAKMISLKDDTLLSTGQYKTIIYLIILSFLHPNPIFDGLDYKSLNQAVNKYITRSINSILCVFVLLRFYFVMRFIIYLTKFMEPKINNICKKHFFETNLFFSIKALIVSNPGLIYSCLGFFTIFSFTFSIRVFERGLAPYVPLQNYDNFFNALWYVLITMTTVGYGDFTVKTNEARTIAMLGCICGGFLISLLLLTLTNFLNLSPNEHLLFNILEKIELNGNKETKAKKVIMNFNKTLKESKSVRTSYYKSEKTFRNLQKSITKFINASNKASSGEGSNFAFSSLNNGIAFMKREYDSLNCGDKKLSEEVRKMKESLERIYEDLCLDNY